MVNIEVDLDDKLYNLICENLGQLDPDEFARKLKIFMNNAVITYLAENRYQQEILAQWTCIEHLYDCINITNQMTNSTSRTAIICASLDKLKQLLMNWYDPHKREPVKPVNKDPLAHCTKCNAFFPLTDRTDKLKIYCPECNNKIGILTSVILDEHGEDFNIQERIEDAKHFMES